MGTITIAALDIGSLVGGFLFGKIAPNIFGNKTAAAPGEHKEIVTELVTAIKGKLAIIETELAKL